MSAKPIVLVTRRLPDAVMARVERDYNARVNANDDVYGTEELLRRAEGCDAILATSTNRFDTETISNLPASVRAVATFSVGTDHIDLEAAKERGLIITNTPDVLTDATADIAMLLLLGAARRAWEGQAMLRDGKWYGWTPTQLLGIHVSGKRLGILGMGRIGQALARRARGFSMAIHYSNRRRLSPDLEAGAHFHARAEDMLPHCDFFSINCPATLDTKGFLNTERIAMLPRTAIVINTARGPIVDDEALIDALEKGRLAAAGLDVFRGEPSVNPGYLSLANAYLLPHMGSATVETRNAMGFKCLDNLDAIFSGRAAPDRVV